MVHLLLAAGRELVKHYTSRSRSLRSQDQTREQGQYIGTVLKHVDGLLVNLLLRRICEAAYNIHYIVCTSPVSS